MQSGLLLCKKDNKPLFFIKESERNSDGSFKVTYSYKCTLCSYRLEVEQMYIKRDGNGLYVKRITRNIPLST